MKNSTIFFINISKVEFMDEISDSLSVYNNEMKQLVSVLADKYNLKRPWEIDAIESAIMNNFEYSLYYIKVNLNRYFICCDFFNETNVNLYSKVYSDNSSSYYVVSFVETDEGKILLNIFNKASLKANILIEPTSNNTFRLKHKNIKLFESLFNVTQNDIKGCILGKGTEEVIENLSTIFSLPLRLNYKEISEHPKKFKASVFCY